MTDHQNQAHVLVVENETGFLKLFEELLRREGFQVYAYRNGNEALNWLVEREPDIVILDAILPGMNGFELCKKIREHYNRAELPVLMVSALGRQASTRVYGLKAGANDVMAKPFDREEFTTRVRIMLEIRLAEAQPFETERRDLPDINETVLMIANTQLPPGSVVQPEVAAMMDASADAFKQVIQQHSGTVQDLKPTLCRARFEGVDEPFVTNFLALQAAMEIQTLFREIKRELKHLGTTATLNIALHRHVHIGENPGTMTPSAFEPVQRMLQDASPDVVVLSDELYENVQTALGYYGLFPLKPNSVSGESTIQASYHIPFSAIKSIEHLANTPKQASKPVETITDKRHVLVSEDDDYLRAMFVKVLRNTGFDVTPVSNGYDTLRYLDNIRPDVIVMDLTMPGPKGSEIIRYIRNTPDIANIKIIVVTGNQRSEHEREVELADYFLLKPVSTRELVALMKQLFQT